MELLRLKSGDIVNIFDKYIVVQFNGSRKVLSTSVYNGGYNENITSVFNHNMMNEEGTDLLLFAPEYEEHLKITAQKLGLNPINSTGVGTAAQMHNVSVSTMEYKDLSVSAIVTAGIETNGGRAGDEAKYYNVNKKPLPGTINIFLFINADMPQGILTRALVTCTEAKTAALQELMADSRYSDGLATGSGTDQTIIAANAESDLYFDSAGKHSKLGELIGKTVITAVKEALKKQNGLTPELQHNLMRRLRRFGITEESVFNTCKELTQDNINKTLFLETLNKITSTEPVFTYGILYIHLLDEYKWKLLTENETQNMTDEILETLSEKLQINIIFSDDIKNRYVKKMEYFLSCVINKELENKQ